MLALVRFYVKENAGYIELQSNLSLFLKMTFVIKDDTTHMKRGFRICSRKKVTTAFFENKASNLERKSTPKSLLRYNKYSRNDSMYMNVWKLFKKRKE